MKGSTPQLRAIAVKAYEEGRANMRQLSEIFGYHIVTIGKWIRAARRGDPDPHHRGRRPPIFSQDELQKLKTYIEDKPDATLQEIREHFAKECSLTTIHKTIKKIGFKFKKNVEGQRARS